MWYCKWEDNGIRVSTDDKEYGLYAFIGDPHCDICYYPGYETEDCPCHADYYGIDKLYSLGAYYPSRSEQGRDDLLVKHILGLKQFKNYAYPLGEAISLCIKNKWEELLAFDMIVPIPELEEEYKVDRSSKQRYNQAVELARIVQRETGLGLFSPLTKTRPQSFRDLNLEERREAIKGLYKTNPAINVSGKSILLIDDVATTLSTSCGCAQVLKNAGASVVNVVVAGRTVLAD